MTTAASATPIRIAAALLEDGTGRMLLVRKAGTPWFMQPGGKVEAGEAALSTLRRELREEIGLVVADGAVWPLGSFAAPAANELGRTVEAELFHVRARCEARPAREIAEARWVKAGEAALLPLAPLTRDYALPLFVKLVAAGDRAASSP